MAVDARPKSGTAAFSRQGRQGRHQGRFQQGGVPTTSNFPHPTGDYEKIPYCVQYRETDLAFVSRLMEHYGIYYFFEHSDGKHSMTLADLRLFPQGNSRSFKKVPYKLPLSHTELRREQHLYSWVSERRFGTGKVQSNDYDYLKPRRRTCWLPRRHPKNINPCGSRCTIIPESTTTKEKGKKLAKFRLEAEQASTTAAWSMVMRPRCFRAALWTSRASVVGRKHKEYLVIRADHRMGPHTTPTRPPSPGDRIPETTNSSRGAASSESYR